MNNVDRPPIELTWQPEQADYVEAYRARNRARKAWLKIAVCTAAVFLIAVLGVAIDDGTLIGAGVGGVVAIGLVVFVVQPRAIRGTWSRNPALRAMTSARVDPQTGLTTSIGTSTGQIQWSGIHSVLETEHLFLIQLAGYRRLPFLVLAKRGLADPGQLDDLRKILAAGTATTTSPSQPAGSPSQPASGTAPEAGVRKAAWRDE
jgi:hypothetical protein